MGSALRRPRGAWRLLAGIEWLIRPFSGHVEPIDPTDPQQLAHGDRRMHDERMRFQPAQPVDRSAAETFRFQLADAFPSFGGADARAEWGLPFGVESTEVSTIGGFGGPAGRAIASELVAAACSMLWQGQRWDPDGGRTPFTLMFSRSCSAAAASRRSAALLSSASNAAPAIKRTIRVGVSAFREA